MKKWTLLDEARTPDGKALTLHEHDGTLTIRIDGLDLMSTRRHASEEKFAKVACEPLAAQRGAHVLIGGLGCGFTLRAALKELGSDARVTVSELLPAVIAWNQNPAYALGADALSDSRVQVVPGDAGRLISVSNATFDAILLDVDNGPAALTARANHGLYDLAGLAAAKKALKPGGVLGVWSAAEDPRFSERLKEAGYRVQIEKARAHTTSGGMHTLYYGHLPT